MCVRINSWDPHTYSGLLYRGTLTHIVDYCIMGPSHIYWTIVSWDPHTYSGLLYRGTLTHIVDYCIMGPSHI